jgi:hypothetical protein
VTLTDNVTFLGDNAFLYCERLATVATGNGLTSIPNAAFMGCGSLTDVAIGGKVTNIVDWAFTGCTSLRGLTIPDNVLKIGDWAFAACSGLRTMTIGKGVSDISFCAFAFCANLTGLYFEGNMPNSPGGADALVGAMSGDTNATVYYLPSTEGWSSTFDGQPTSVWNPQVQSDSAGIQSSQFGFTVNWASGMVVGVEACTNLANPVWSPVQTITLTNGSSYFSDPQWTNYATRFYRIRSP